MSPGRGALGMLVVWLVLWAAVPGHAHLGHVVQRAERYLKLEASSGTFRLVVSLSLGAQETPNVFGAADLDSDRTLTRSEADAYLQEWLAGLEEELEVQVDGRRVELTWGDAYMEPVGLIQAVPSAVEAVGRLEVEAGVHTVSVYDGMRVGVFDRTDIAFRYRDGATLLASGSGASPTRRVRDLVVAGSGAAHQTITGRFRWPEPLIAPPADEGALAPWAKLAWATTLVGCLCGIIGWWRRRKSRRST